MSTRSEERAAALRQAKQKHLDRLRSEREEKRLRLKGRGRRFLKGALAAAVCVFGVSLMLSRSELHSSLEAFNGMCRNVRDGTPLEAVRGLAAENRILFEPDDEATSSAGELVYALKPESDWPARFACRYRVRDTRLYHYR